MTQSSIGWSALGRGIVLMLMIVVITGCAVFQNTQEDEDIKQSQWHYDMAAGYFEANDTTFAIRELTKSLELDPDNDKAHYLMGFIYMGRRDYTRSIHHFREVLRIDPQYHFAKNNLGSVYLATERWEDAAELFGELLEETLYTTPELAHNNVGWAYFNMGRNAEALEHLRMAIYLSPGMCLAENNKARVLDEMGNLRQAERHYRRAIDKCPSEYQEPHFYLGRLLSRQGNQNAEAHFRRCIEIRSQNDLADRCQQYLDIH